MGYMGNKNDKLFDRDTLAKELRENAGVTGGDLISVKGLDEMQKAYTYEITFRLFTVFFWFMLVLSFIMLCTAFFPEQENFALKIFALITEISALIMQTVYAAKTSAKGVMNGRYAKFMARKSNMAGYLIMGAFQMWIFRDWGIVAGLYIFLLYLSFFIIGFFAHRNNRIAEQQDEES